MHWLLAHFIGDWLFQGDGTALAKKESTLICLRHVCIYMVLFLLVPGMVWWKFLLIAVQHYAIDRTQFVSWWLRTFNRKNFLKEDHPMFPLGYIVTDQLLHIVWIALVMAL